ncbi:MAG: sigma-54-dependent Fis family transcriptional regulator, partial [Desulfovibrio sp.]|nr:sigma-54-dependent Fis family transcriptional regulator [Desulfovibrio sp.]
RALGFIGHSSEMENVYQLINQVAKSEATVLLEGESGTGKELAAQAIHAQSLRSAGPFISLNCAALPEHLMESELFGHEKGAFTDAHTMRKGRFELAKGGTLFLDEIGELPLLTQAKLLRVLQNHTFERVGGMTTQQVDSRIIAATNRNLAQMVEQGQFRQDLFYRLNVFPITMPPLRSRPEDILPLFNYFLRKFAQENGHAKVRVSYAAMDLLVKYSWPGNVRELENVAIRSLLLLGQQNLITAAHLPANLQKDQPATEAVKQNEIGQSKQEFGQPLPELVANLEKEAIKEALTNSQGRMKSAAKVLGLTERCLGLKMKKYQISYKDFR